MNTQADVWNYPLTPTSTPWTSHLADSAAGILHVVASDPTDPEKRYLVRDPLPVAAPDAAHHGYILNADLVILPPTLGQQIRHMFPNFMLPSGSPAGRQPALQANELDGTITIGAAINGLPAIITFGTGDWAINAIAQEDIQNKECRLTISYQGTSKLQKAKLEIVGGTTYESPWVSVATFVPNIDGDGIWTPQMNQSNFGAEPTSTGLLNYSSLVFRYNMTDAEVIAGGQTSFSILHVKGFTFTNEGHTAATLLLADDTTRAVTGITASFTGAENLILDLATLNGAFAYDGLTTPTPVLYAIG